MSRIAQPKPGSRKAHVFKVVLTGGPCGGKTTGQARLSSFFENLGWRVYRSPEAATVLLNGGIKFPELSHEQTYQFQVNLLKSIMAIEKTFDDLARTSDRKCLIICDRGCMDAVGFMTPEMWVRAKRENNWDEVQMRDSRYDLIVHMISAAQGAEAFYTLENNRARMENDLELARARDEKAAHAWLGHPYVEVVDNSTGFEEKIRRMIALVCERVDVNVGDRLSATSLKRKFLIRAVPDDETMRRRVEFVDFDVEHDYLANSTDKRQSRIRKRGRNGVWTYQQALRFEANGQMVETKTTLSQRDYKALRAQRSVLHGTVYKKRRCFLFEQQYYQLDTFLDSCPARCRGVVLLETYTTAAKGTQLELPDFLAVIREVTGQREFSMFTMSLINPNTQCTFGADLPHIVSTCSHTDSPGSTFNASVSRLVNGNASVSSRSGTNGNHFSFDDVEDFDDHGRWCSSLPQSPTMTEREREREREREEDGAGVSRSLVVESSKVLNTISASLINNNNKPGTSCPPNGATSDR